MSSRQPQYAWRIGPGIGDYYRSFPLSTGQRSYTASAALVAALVAAPVIAVVISTLSPRWEIWEHLLSTQLPRISLNTIKLVLGVSLCAGTIGVTLGWVVAVREFPGRRFFEWALVLPMAIPPYIAGFILIAMLDFAGPVQSWMRETFGPDVRIPPIRSYGGVVIAMSFVSYPYVYLLARAAFAERGATLIEAAQSLGQSSRAAFWRLALPLARPAIAAGLALALMEALGDFGTVSLFGYDTFTSAIYRVWFGMFDRVAAGQIALILMLFAFSIVLLERLAQGRARFTSPGKRGATRIEGRGWRRYLDTALCASILLVSFALPVAVLIGWTWRSVRAGSLATTYGTLVRNSLTAAVIAALLATAVALLLSWAVRQNPSRRLRALVSTSMLGYAVPGSVIAVGSLMLLSRLDELFAKVAAALSWSEPPFFAMATVAGLMFAYVVRFLAAAFYPVRAGLERIPLALDESARSLGAGAGRTLREIHAPLLKTSILTALILVVVEVIKEMPVTMLMRPFGFDTLAVEIWQRTTESLWMEAAPPALTIVVLSAVLVAFLTRLYGVTGEKRSTG